MKVCPLSLREANDFVAQYHRHNGRTSANGGKFALGACHEEELVGVAIVGRCVARNLSNSVTCEVLRVCVKEGAPKGTNSFLYGACWRAWRALGGERLITYTLIAEGGASLRGANWRVVAETNPGGWDRDGRPRKWQPIYGEKKLRWEVSV